MNESQLSNSKAFWEKTATRFGGDPLGVVMTPTDPKILNKIRDFFQRRVLIPELALLSGKPVLEIGCGNGRWLSRGSRLGLEMIGIDLSAKMLRLAKNLLRNRNCELVNAAASCIPLRDGQVDCILSVTTMQHMVAQNRTAKVISEFRRTLKADGSVVLLESVIDRRHEHTTQDYPTVMRSLDSWKQMFRDQNLLLVEQKPVYLSLGTKPLNIVGSYVARKGRFYSSQLSGDTGAIQRLLKNIWDITSVALLILSFPLDLVLTGMLGRLSTHRLMIFRAKQSALQ